MPDADPIPVRYWDFAGLDWYTIRTSDGIAHSHADYRGHPDACPHPHGQSSITNTDIHADDDPTADTAY